MGVYVRGMEMPTSCGSCPFEESINFCYGKKETCPLVPVQSHGRLVDADALCELCDIMAEKCDGIGESIWHQFKTTVEWSPTIIPAEEGE